MPLGPGRARRGVVGRPVARTAAVVGTAAVVAHGVGRRHDRRGRPPRRPQRSSLNDASLDAGAEDWLGAVALGSSRLLPRGFCPVMSLTVRPVVTHKHVSNGPVSK